MPAGNKTGPEGRGPLTGKRMGSCSGNNTSDLSFSGGFDRGFRRGLTRNFGRGFRRGFGNYNYSEPQYSSDKEMLKNEITALKEQLSFLETKLSENPDKD